MMGVGLALLVLFGAWMLYKDYTDNQVEDSSTVLTSPVNPDGNTETVDYAIEMDSYSFSPAVIEASPGETIKIQVSTISGGHDFRIDELSLESSFLTTGEQETLEITIPDDMAPGDYDFHCTVGSHRSLGMEGVLRITEEL